MAVERRGIPEIRAELASEREQLAAALADLRRAFEAKRKPAARAGGLLATGLAALVTAKAVRRVRGR